MTLYQLEVKVGLARFAFPRAEGWRVSIHVDPMEIGRGGRQTRGKVKRAKAAMRELEKLGVKLGIHKLYGAIDVVAEGDGGQTRFVEVEGESSRQREQALYSALGQLMLSMKLWSDDVSYGIAVPDTREWWNQLRKIPLQLTKRLKLWRYSVGVNSCTSIGPGTSIPDWSRG